MHVFVENAVSSILSNKFLLPCLSTPVFVEGAISDNLEGYCMHTPHANLAKQQPESKAAPNRQPSCKVPTHCTPIEPPSCSQSKKFVAISYVATPAYQASSSDWSQAAQTGLHRFHCISNWYVIPFRHFHFLYPLQALY